MIWLVCVLALLGALGILVRAKRVRYERRLARDLRAFVVVRAPRASRVEPPALPPVVARYRALAVGDHANVCEVRLVHGGTFRRSPTAKASLIRGQQVFTTDPPGFLWAGRVRVGPGGWIDVRDMLVDGRGSMRVLLVDLIPLANAQGPKIDQGAALRMLAEMPWFPTALFDARSVTWSAIDERHARASLRSGDLEVSGIFEFGPDGLPIGMSADREYKEHGLRPWEGVYRDWRTVDGMRVPFEADVSWQLDSGPYTYAHWLVESIAYEDG